MQPLTTDTARVWTWVCEDYVPDLCAPLPPMEGTVQEWEDFLAYEPSLDLHCQGWGSHLYCETAMLDQAFLVFGRSWAWWQIKDSHKLLDNPIIERCLRIPILREVNHQVTGLTTLGLTYCEEAQTTCVQSCCAREREGYPACLSYYSHRAAGWRHSVSQSFSHLYVWLVSCSIAS